MKVTVRIHTSHGLEIRTVNVRRGNKLHLGKEWEPKLVGFEPKHLHFSRTRFFTDIWENAPETWSYNQGLKPEQQPKLTQEQVRAFAKAEIFKRRYRTSEKPVPNWLLYAILLAVIAIGLIEIAISTGRLRI